MTDQEQRYYKCSQVNELRDELKRLQQQHSKQAIEMKRRLDDKQSKAEDISLPSSSSSARSSRAPRTRAPPSPSPPS